MRVALLTREFPPEVYGGAGVHVGELALALAGSVEVRVHCFGAARPSPLVQGAYEPWPRLGELAGTDPLGAVLGVMSVDLAMVAGLGSVDLCHSHTWYANLAGHLAKLGRGIPHVVTVHSLEPLRPWKAEQLGGGYALSSFCERVGLEGCDAVIAVSAAMAADVVRSYPTLDASRVEVIHNGVDTDAWRPDPGTDVLERYGVDPTRPLVFFVGRLTRQKGLPYLLEATAGIDGAAQVVICTGAADTEALARETERLVARVRDRPGGLIWIEAVLKRGEVAQLHSHAAASVCPSIYEPFGLVNLEAMACGAPVVASAVGGIPEVVEDGLTGLLVPFAPTSPADPEPADPAGFARDLAAAINTLVGDPQLARRMGEAGRRRVVEEFSWAAVAARTVSLYRALVS